LSDGKQSVPISAALRQSVGAKGVVYQVPSDLTNADIPESLQTQVKYANDLIKTRGGEVVRDSYSFPPFY